MTTVLDLMAANLGIDKRAIGGEYCKGLRRSKAIHTHVAKLSTGAGREDRPPRSLAGASADDPALPPGPDRHAHQEPPARHLPPRLVGRGRQHRSPPRSSLTAMTPPSGPASLETFMVTERNLTKEAEAKQRARRPAAAASRSSPPKYWRLLFWD